MKVSITKKFTFGASHQLPGDQYGECQHLHGHTYHLEVEIEGKLNRSGWIMNFSDLKKIVQEEIIDRFDHAHLNEFFDVPTAENIAVWIFRKLSERMDVTQVVLYETPTSFARIKK